MGKFSQFKLPLRSLAPGVHTFEYHLDKFFFENMESQDVRDADVNVKLTVDFHNDVYVLSFELKGTVTVPCDRCLDDLELPVDTTYCINVKYGDDYRDDSDEIIEIPFGDAFLNVAYMIYDTVSLSIPIKHVHPLGKCNRAMSSLLRKHRAHSETEADDEIENKQKDEMDTMTDDTPSDSPED